VNSNQKAGAGPLHTRVVAIDDEAFAANGDLTMAPLTLGRDVVRSEHGDDHARRRVEGRRANSDRGEEAPRWA
jgi:hypothetical protein